MASSCRSRSVGTLLWAYAAAPAGGGTRRDEATPVPTVPLAFGGGGWRLTLPCNPVAPGSKAFGMCPKMGSSVGGLSAAFGGGGVTGQAAAPARCTTHGGNTSPAAFLATGRAS